ncbi:MAG: AAA family ATPase [Bradymonadia bacterium]
MSVQPSPELEEVYAQALDIAYKAGQQLSSAHLLLAVFTLPNLAEVLLLDRAVDEITLLDRITHMEHEPPDVVDRLMERAARLAAGCGQSQISCLHLVGALTRMPDAFAHRLLARSGVNIAELRNTSMRYATDGVPPRLLTLTRAMEGADLGASTAQQGQRSNSRGGRPQGPKGSGGGRGTTQRTPRGHQGGERDTVIEDDIPTAVFHKVPSKPGGGRSKAKAPSPTFDRRQSRGRRREDRKVERRIAVGSPNVGARHTTPPKAMGDDTRPSPYVLSRDRFKWLTLLGRNLSHLAYLDHFDPVLGRDQEIEEAIDILNKRRSNNPCLIGRPGVGKTAIVEGMATRMVTQDQLHRAGRPGKVVVQIDVGTVLAGTHLRGSLSERLRGLQAEVEMAEGQIIIFIDELHTLIGAGGADGAADAANELKAALARGSFPCIGATTIDEYAEYIESDPAMVRRFTSVHVEEPDEQTTVEILQGVVGRYSQHHGVDYSDEAVRVAVKMSRRYITDKADPDRSLAILDLAGAVARRAEKAVDRHAVAEVVARMARVPLDQLVLDDPSRFLEMESLLARRIVGQAHTLTAIGETIRRNLAGFSSKRPIGSFLFLGSTGVGKTEVVKALAQFLFGSVDYLTRIDMSEYLESHALARLIGAPPGYVGHSEGGQLTEAVRRRPYQVVLFDEIEKAHRDVWNVLLQVLDEGRLTDGRGRLVDFTNTVVVMTSNLGADVFENPDRRPIGFAGGTAGDSFEKQSEAAKTKARKQFPPELWNRIERRLVFHPLSKADIRAVARLIIEDRARMLGDEKNIRFTADDAAIEVLIERGGYEPALGARPMRQTISREIEGPLAQKILAGEVVSGDAVQVVGEDGELRFEIIDA